MLVKTHFDGYNDQLWESCDLGLDAQQSADRETAASKRQRARFQQDQSWKERQPEHCFRRYCRLASEIERRQAPQHQVQAEVLECLATVVAFCQQWQAPFQLFHQLRRLQLLASMATSQLTILTFSAAVARGSQCTQSAWTAFLQRHQGPTSGMTISSWL